MSEVVRYRVSVIPERHELTVSMTVPPGIGGRPLRLASPTWVPGDYSFNPYGRDVFEVKATDEESGAQLATSRDGWQGYLVHRDNAAAVIRYRAYCSSWDFSKACGIVGDLSGIVTGARYLLSLGIRGPVW